LSLIKMHLLLLGSDNALGEALLRQASAENIALESIPAKSCTKAHLASWLKQGQGVQPTALLNLLHYADSFQVQPLSEAALDEQEQLGGWLADYCADQGIILLQPSSYRVFDGMRTIAYDEEQPLAPLGWHAQWLARLEQQARRCPQHLLLRLGWLLDESVQGDLHRFLLQAMQGGSLPAADDRRGSPTLVDDAARVLLAVLKQLDCGAPLWGTYHYGGHEASTALALYQTILDEAKAFRPELATKLLATPHELCPDGKEEPQHAVLSCKKILDTFGIKPRAWRVGLADLLARYFQQH